MKRIMASFVIILTTVAIAMLVYVRIAPDTVERWHLDPETVKPTRRPNHYRLVGDQAETLDISQAILTEIILDYVGDQDGVSLLANTNDGQLITFVQRSKLIGYPDYITFKITPQGDSTQLSVFSRSRYGYRDFGVNKSRAEAWMHAVRGLCVGR